MTNKSDNAHVKVLVHTPSEDGYPPEEWEGLWAVPFGDGYFKIDNIPYYAKNLSCDDIVEVEYQDDAYVLKRVIKPSENSTIRVILYDLADEEDVRKELFSMGCAMEGTGTAGLIAVNVPKANIEQVLNFLNDAFKSEKLDFEEGTLR